MAPRRGSSDLHPAPHVVCMHPTLCAQLTPPCAATLPGCRREQEEREARKEAGLPPPPEELPPVRGSHDSGDPFSTNLFIGNLAPDVDEQVSRGWRAGCLMPGVGCLCTAPRHAAGCCDCRDASGLCSLEDQQYPACHPCPDPDARVWAVWPHRQRQGDVAARRGAAAARPQHRLCVLHGERAWAGPGGCESGQGGGLRVGPGGCELGQGAASRSRGLRVEQHRCRDSQPGYLGLPLR